MKPILELGWLELFAFTLFVLSSRAVVVAGGGSLWLYISTRAKKFSIDSIRNHKRTWVDDALYSFVILVYDAAWTMVAVKTGWLVLDETPTLLNTLVTFGCAFVWVEIFFYYSHRLLHHPKLFWIHKRHHIYRPTTPWSSLAFSFTERTTLVIGTLLFPSILSHIVPFSLAGYSFYFLFNFIFNVYGHLNVETIPHRWVKESIWGRHIYTTTYHALHHIRYNGHFGLFTRFLDRWHNTEFPDYLEKHKEASEAS